MERDKNPPRTNGRTEFVTLLVLLQGVQDRAATRSGTGLKSVRSHQEMLSCIVGITQIPLQGLPKEQEQLKTSRNAVAELTSLCRAGVDAVPQIS